MITIAIRLLFLLIGILMLFLLFSLTPIKNPIALFFLGIMLVIAFFTFPTILFKSRKIKVPSGEEAAEGSKA